jgi:hypothetical protein
MVKKRVELGWYLRGANRGGSGWPSGSKIGLGAGRVGRVDLAALRVIVCLTPPQMNDFCDLLGTPYASVSKIAPVKVWALLLC